MASARSKSISRRRRAEKVGDTRSGRDRRAAGAGRRARRPLSRRRKWAFRVVCLTVVPAAVLLLLEAGLRIFGYGFDTAFLVRLPQRSADVSNERFGWRFFPPHLARTPHPFVVEADKPTDVYRIFILGGSAARGVPDPAFNFGRILEVMLSERYPATRFEVFNAAMTAINSHVVLPIARDCARHRPDLFVVYMGNNEVVGPYGPGTIFGGLPSSLTAIRLSVWTRSTRTGQLIGNLLHWAGRKPLGPAEWQGMAMFVKNRVRADDPRLEAVYDYFRANLNDICRAARRSGAQCILATVITNLKDCAPFGSMHRPNLSESERTEWQGGYEKGIARQADGDYSQAVEQYSAAARIDDTFAELHYRLAQCYQALGRPDQARDHYVRARDLDVLRFRADSRINDTIRQVAARQRGRGVHLVDVEKALLGGDKSAMTLPGRELLYEHVHLNFEGNYRLARLIFDGVVRVLPERIRRSGTGPAEPPTVEDCAKRLALSGWDRYRHAHEMEKLTGKAPFTNQFDHDGQMQRLRAKIKELEPYSRPEGLDQAFDLYRAAIRKRPDDVALRVNLTILQSQRADYAGMEQNARMIAKLAPHAFAYYVLGNAEYGQGKAEEALASYRRAIQINPYLTDARQRMAMVLVSQDRTDEAIRELRAILKVRPSHAQVLADLGTLLMKTGSYAEADHAMRQSLTHAPDDIGVLSSVVTFLAKCPDPQWRDPARAIELATHACELTDRQNPMALMSLAAAYGSAYRLDEAADAARRAAELFERSGRVRLAARIRRELNMYRPQEARPPAGAQW